VSRFATGIGLAVAGAAALVYERARRIAESEGRPLSEVLAEVPSQLLADLRTIGDDLREAADEGREAAARREQELEDELQAARG
jgi:DNA anti-recombination protein RmuC